MSKECLYNRSSSYAKFYSRSHDAVIRVNDDADNVIETHEHKGDFGLHNETLSAAAMRVSNPDRSAFKDRELRPSPNSIQQASG